MLRIPPIYLHVCTPMCVCLFIHGTKLTHIDIKTAKSLMAHLEWYWWSVNIFFNALITSGKEVEESKLYIVYIDMQVRIPLRIQIEREKIRIEIDTKPFSV